MGPFSAKVRLRTLHNVEGETSQPWPHSKKKKEAGVQIQSFTKYFICGSDFFTKATPVKGVQVQSP